jgi:hypothetical protein
MKHWFLCSSLLTFLFLCHLVVSGRCHFHRQYLGSRHRQLVAFSVSKLSLAQNPFPPDLKMLVEIRVVGALMRMKGLSLTVFSVLTKRDF